MRSILVLILTLSALTSPAWALDLGTADTKGHNKLDAEVTAARVCKNCYPTDTQDDRNYRTNPVDSRVDAVSAALKSDGNGNVDPTETDK